MVTATERPLRSRRTLSENFDVRSARGEPKLTSVLWSLRKSATQAPVSKPPAPVPTRQTPRARTQSLMSSHQSPARPSAISTGVPRVSGLPTPGSKPSGLATPGSFSRSVSGASTGIPPPVPGANDLRSPGNNDPAAARRLLRTPSFTNTGRPSSAASSAGSASSPRSHASASMAPPPLPTMTPSSRTAATRSSNGTASATNKTPRASTAPQVNSVRTSSQSGPHDFEVGDHVRIESLGMEGTLRYLGPIDGKPGVFAGVELAPGFSGHGKNDGSVGGCVLSRLFLPTD